MLSRLTTAALGALVILSGPPAARLRRVPADYPTIQEAIDSAEPGDTVLVAPGRYVENIRFEGKGIVVASDYVLKHDPAVIGRTIIDGSRPRHPDTASVVLMIDQEDTTAKLIGFTLTGGRGTIWTDARQKAQYREGGGGAVRAGLARHRAQRDRGQPGGRSRARHPERGRRRDTVWLRRADHPEQRDPEQPRRVRRRRGAVPLGRDGAEQSDRRATPAVRDTAARASGSSVPSATGSAISSSRIRSWATSPCCPTRRRRSSAAKAAG